LLYVSSIAARADVTLVDYYQDANGVWHYEYEVSNASDATDNIYDWMLIGVGPAFPESTPAGWEIAGRSPYYGPGYIGWTAEVGSEIAPGQSVSGFVVRGARPGDVLWETHGDQGSLEQGGVIGPIPEPWTGYLMLIGMGVLGQFVIRRKTVLR